MAIAVANCCFSVLNSTVKLRCSISSQRRLALPHASIVSNNKNFKTPSPSTSKPTTADRKFPRRSKDGGGDNEHSKSSAFKSSGVQRKDKKEFRLSFKEQQIDATNLQDAAFLNAVVKVYCTHTAPDYSLPWQKQRQYTSTGSAFMIGEGKLLTNAHCVEHYTQVKVKRRGDDTKYVAKVSNFIYNHGWVLALMRNHTKKELIRPAPTRFATAFLTLDRMLSLRQPLEHMFTSKEWDGCSWAKKAEGKEIKKIIFNDNFWGSMSYALKTTRPLVSVLRMTDSEQMPAMGFIYGAMDKAKEEIAANLGNEEGAYKEIWKIIDEKWEFQLHRHLHAAAYYLNPRIQYSDGLSTHLEVKIGLMVCMEKLIPDEEERVRANLQLNLFKNKQGFFTYGRAKNLIENLSPADWWSAYGDEAPELRSFAVKILSLTCSSSACERNWSTFNLVLARGVDCDIALLSVESEEFWKGAEPLQFGHLPRLQDAVTVVGYPLGGDTISVTKGVVSRIEVTSYAHGSSELLGIQIDAAINPGNSGGPAFNDQGECIGVAFQVYRSEEVENIGYVIPTTVVSHFLDDYERHGKYTGFPCLGVLLQKLENPALRACLKVQSNEGVLVRRIEPTSDAYNVLKEGDVIVSFDDLNVGCEGTVPFRSNERIAFRYLISQKFAGDVAELGIIRAGSFMKVKVVLNPRVHLVPYHIDGGQPSYLIIAGLVFTPLSEPLIEEECEDTIGLKLLAKARYSLARFKGEQIVILSQVLANELNIGYEDMGNQQVLKFNGTRIKNIHHLAHLVDSCKDKYLVFEFEDNYFAVLERETATSASTCILKDYGIPSERSSDLLEPYMDPLGENQAIEQDYGDSPVSNLEIGVDGLLWA